MNLEKKSIERNHKLLSSRILRQKAEEQEQDKKDNGTMQWFGPLIVADFY